MKVASGGSFAYGPGRRRNLVGEEVTALRDGAMNDTTKARPRSWLAPSGKYASSMTITAVVLLDMVGRVDLHIQEDLYSDPQLRRLCWSAAVATGHETKFFRAAEAAKDDHVPFLKAGIPAIDLIDLKGNPYWHTRYDTLEFLSADSLRAVADVVLTMIPNIGPR